MENATLIGKHIKITLHNGVVLEGTALGRFYTPNHYEIQMSPGVIIKINDGVIKEFEVKNEVKNREEIIYE